MALIEFEHTPNPDALRVQNGQVFTHGAALDFDRTNAGEHPLVAGLLAIGGIERVMLGRGFVTVVRSGPDVSWDVLRPEIALALLEAGDCAPAAPVHVRTAPLGEVERHIEEVLDRYVRHLLAKDGGERPRSNGSMQPMARLGSGWGVLAEGVPRASPRSSGLSSRPSSAGCPR